MSKKDIWSILLDNKKLEPEYYANQCSSDKKNQETEKILNVKFSNPYLYFLKTLVIINFYLLYL